VQQDGLLGIVLVILTAGAALIGNHHGLFSVALRGYILAFCWRKPKWAREF
jgi:hypothetical protein